MKLTLGSVRYVSRRPGDKLAYNTIDMLDDMGRKVGSVNQCGYAPRWAYNFAQFRWTQRGFAGPFDGAAFDTAESARSAAEQALLNYLLRANPTAQASEPR